MDSFKYEIYDYSKAGLRRERVLHRKVVSYWECEAFKVLGNSEDEIASIVFKHLKRKFEKNRPKIYDYSPNFDFDYEIIMSDKIYKFHETSGKKE